MSFHSRKRLLVAAAMIGVLAVFAAAFFVAPTGRSVVAGPDAGPAAGAPTPVGHEWIQVEGHGTGTGLWWLGTTDNQALELWVNNARALRLEPNATSPNLIGGVSFNSVTSGVKGATIGGGGANLFRNQVTDDYGVVGGGRINLAGNDADGTDDATFATVGGGQSNIASGAGATVGGGSENAASDSWATIAGGGNNTASGPKATVGGGYQNESSGDTTTVGGGADNMANGQWATLAGGKENSATGGSATVGGGYQNEASSNAATVGGGANNTASGDSATVAGGEDNTASASFATIAGGGPSDPEDPNTRNRVTDDYGTIGGGGNNAAGNGGPDTSDAQYATVPGGEGNSASGWWATVGGGNANRVTDDYGTVGGGGSNQAGDDVGNTDTAPYATVGGGSLNTASGEHATVGGGQFNNAGAMDATVGGGQSNTASGATAATVGGGGYNTATGFVATVGGGYSNTASGSAAMVLGGALNTAQGDYSFAAGYRAKANNQGCFVWGDSTDADFTCSTNNRFQVRASGGVYLYTNSGLTSGAYLSAGSGSWSSVSDRNLKENFTPVDGQEVLASLAEIPITIWNYTTEDSSIRHMGPVAQDLYAAFGLGESETSISTVDADGVALAAIQGLYQLSQGQDARIQALEEENASLREQLDGLDARVAALEGGAGVDGGSVGPLSASFTAGGLLLGGLVVGGLVVVQRRRAGGRR